MARACGLSVSTVQRIWRAFGLQPHRLETFKLSTDPDFVALADTAWPSFNNRRFEVTAGSSLTNRKRWHP